MVSYSLVGVVEAVTAYPSRSMLRQGGHEGIAVEAVEDELSEGWMDTLKRG